MLPAYSNLNQFNLAVQSADDPTVKVSGAVVRVQTTIGTSAVGTTGNTEFARSGTTNANGIASLSLLPGSQNTSLSYSVTVTPPTNSPYASQCAGPFEVKAGGSTVNSPSAPMLTSTPIMLATRPVLTGTVTDGAGYLVANVSVTATPGPVSSGACAAASTSPSSTIDRWQRSVQPAARSWNLPARLRPAVRIVRTALHRADPLGRRRV